jgi:hypothetical protein
MANEHLLYFKINLKCLNKKAAKFLAAFLLCVTSNRVKSTIGLDSARPENLFNYFIFPTS